MGLPPPQAPNWRDMEDEDGNWAAVSAPVYFVADGVSCMAFPRRGFPGVIKCEYCGRFSNTLGSCECCGAANRPCA